MVSILYSCCCIALLARSSSGAGAGGGSEQQSEPLGSSGSSSVEEDVVALFQTASGTQSAREEQSSLAFSTGLLLDATVEAAQAAFLEASSYVQAEQLHQPPQHQQRQQNQQKRQTALWKQLTVPVVALAIGSVCLLTEHTKLIGKLILFFGAQTFMNLYMKAVLSRSVVSTEHNLRGVPAAFAITALQQMTSFVLLVLGTAASQATPWAYRPKILATPRHYMMVLLFALCFTLNIALNNFSLSILDISVNLIIRSVAPVTTLLCQLAFSSCLGRKAVDRVETILMVTGCVCGVIAVIAKGNGVAAGSDGAQLIFGSVICLMSLFSAGMELILAGVLGGSLGLNPVDTTLYMAIPSTLMLLVPVFCVPHFIKWPGYGAVTDWAILKEVLRLSPGTFCLAILSGAFALIYNVLLYTIVQTLSAPFSAFTSNFNKAATIALSLLMGFEIMPGAPWGVVMVMGVLGNIGAFTVYGLRRALPKDFRALMKK